MGDEGTSEGAGEGAGDADRTVSLTPEELFPPAPPPDPIDLIELRRTPAPPDPSDPSDPQPRERHGRGLVWIGVVVALTAVFVAACYLIVARAESDRGEGPSDLPSTTEATTTTASTTTTAPPPVTHDPATVTVAVLNGTEQEGWARENAEKLEPAGFPTTTTDAIASPETTTVYVAADDLRPDATVVAQALGLPDAPVELRPEAALASNASDQDAQIVVVLGTDSLDG